jgi:hypothetical protein
MSWIEIISDRKIREAQDEGVFDNLPGKGQPLNLDFDPRVPADQRAMQRLLKEARFVPDWIRAEADLRRKQEGIDARIAAFAGRFEDERAGTNPTSETELRRRDERRDRFLVQMAQEMAELDRLIERYNLIVPVLSRQRRRLDLTDRMSTLEARFPRSAPRHASEPAPWSSLLKEDPQPTRISNRMPLRRGRNRGV